MKTGNNGEQSDPFIVVDQDTEINVLAILQFDHTMSIRETAQECDISRSTVHRILRKHKYKLFKYQLYPHLYPTDFERRLEYCNWFIEELALNADFPSLILYSDESRFSNLGMFNKNNTRYWSQNNQHLMVEGNYQERYGFNCWLGVVGQRLVGPIFFDSHLTGERYQNFFNGYIADFLDNLPLNYQNRLFFQQDGAPPHNTRAVREMLIDMFAERWIGTNGPIRWPPW